MGTSLRQRVDKSGCEVRVPGKDAHRVRDVAACGDAVIPAVPWAPWKTCRTAWETLRAGLMRSLYVTAGVYRQLEDLDVTRSLLAGNEVVAPIHVAVIVHGNYLNVYHSMFFSDISTSPFAFKWEHRNSTGLSRGG